ncbi:hypothetical protein GUITHDRAFT_112625 [Guillardia theta CCMP2712]|uniref:Uncharacterized protein n=1 Tax=Guillardia theta (strain CCMP2712) TaxID=905079 RepID=L1IYR5_GUITC|nr:hypothetical protein GUITHDRAFT_112625 [Guillardia theta CCMP2712]EKX41408.1 hypothetical protein GUITHDRAFT_112625 [Guillardia theta CCMP2712]|eukprot:XP_005828388.1 hypothetical protein GUITHDRAFT_112625 [Guillardia theta CCMP2712]
MVKVRRGLTQASFERMLETCVRLQRRVMEQEMLDVLREVAEGRHARACAEELEREMRDEEAVQRCFLLGCLDGLVKVVEEALRLDARLDARSRIPLGKLAGKLGEVGVYWEEEEEEEERTGLELALFSSKASRDSVGCSPLILACEQGGARAQREVELLLDVNADPRVKDFLGRTALELALRWEQQEIADRLIAAGSDVGEALDRLRTEKEDRERGQRWETEKVRIEEEDKKSAGYGESSAGSQKGFMLARVHFQAPGFAMLDELRRSGSENRLPGSRSLCPHPQLRPAVASAESDKRRREVEDDEEEEQGGD